ncbi:hypothetical protein AAHC03_09364 [Spirometra sp. Aus1]
MLPTAPTTSDPHTKIDLSFVPSEASGNPDAYTASLTGNIDAWTRGPEGTVSGILRRRGFGWMLEVDGEEDGFDKPLLEELDIDVNSIAKKMKAVILPCAKSGLDPTAVREHPDFWGPLLVVILFSFVSLVGQLRVVSWIIAIWLAGSFIVYFITRSLGGEVAYAQCLGVIGYCLLPQFLMCAVSSLFNLIAWHRFGLFVAFLGTIWSAYSAGKMLSMGGLQNRCSLVAYPVGLLRKLIRESWTISLLTFPYLRSSSGAAHILDMLSIVALIALNE